ncbi:MAG TPA: CoB--CoM heterodisulfide reductase iron-sulfur subunit A family protein [Anaerolineae bacterium]|nr:CoB--CoM heterodisulfide reductase iron-sulfur subunit A family protein [Anaerolineae bacterium]HOQ98248.1 CoB--CoM heterodisulfide reductase iron-sulfur subunit A family protein [Anaerolineae bacterium]HPL27440.1 CoB--CoM heterodisulfide reductase iron-sulfur subunit A family protein [Anaerolineae bacterium]
MAAAQAGQTRALIIGAGIAGIQAALDIANSGYDVALVERLPSVGGHMAQLSETFPTLDCSQCILTPRTVEVGHHPHIRLLTYSELESLEGEPGHFVARIRRRPPYVRWDVCTGCGVCTTKCPTKVPAEFEGGLGPRKAIYTLSPQAVPNKPVIDREHCRYFTQGKCRICEKLCPVGAIDYEQAEEIVEETVGAVIVASGYQLLPLGRLPEYGGGAVPDVIDGLQFERLLSASGPTAGKVRRPSDGREPKTVVLVQCAGSRDPEHGVPYCSKICCMYTAKHALLYRHRVHDGRAIVFYIDIRSGGKGYEEFVQRAMEEERVLYLRGKVSKIFRDGERVMVWGTDTLTGRNVEVAADLVVLAAAATPDAAQAALAQALGIAAGADGFLDERDATLAPVETGRPGVYMAGAALGPKDIPETVAQGSAAAAKVLGLFARWRAEPELAAQPGHDLATDERR